MKNWLKIILIFAALAGFSVLIIALLTQVAQNNTTFGILVASLLGVAAFGLLFVGYWLLTQLLAGVSQISSNVRAQPEARQKRTPPQPEKPAAAKPKPETRQEKANRLETIKKQYPNAVFIDTRTIIQEYQSGRRDFQNVYPTAQAEYETYLMWAILDGVDFSRAMLAHAPFDGTSLIGATFNGAYLENASFKNVSLRQADLSWTDLSRANLNGADLTGANLSYAILNGTDLTNAVLVGAEITPEQLEKAGSLQGATLPDGTQQK